jgi:hypothetical protein
MVMVRQCIAAGQRKFLEIIEISSFQRSGLEEAIRPQLPPHREVPDLLHIDPAEPNQFVSSF